MRVIVQDGESGTEWVLDEDADFDPDAAFEAVAMWGLEDDRTHRSWNRSSMSGEFFIGPAGSGFRITLHEDQP